MWRRRGAIAYRAKFQRDFSSTSSATAAWTQRGRRGVIHAAVEYQRIGSHPTAREIWARTLIERGTLSEEEVEALNRKHTGELQAALDALKPEQDFIEPEPEAPPPGAASRAETGVPLEHLRELNTALLTLPSGFSMHRKLERVREKRHHALNDEHERTVDWSLAEELALASILADGISIRLTGRTSSAERSVTGTPCSTTSTTDGCTCRCRRCRRRRHAFEVHNSPLTENAVVGSSTATTFRSRRLVTGKRIRATSSTARR